MNRRRGFTLIELLCVLAVIAIVSALAAPALNSALTGMAVSNGANQVFAILSLARQDAITRNRPVAVYFFQYATSSQPAAYRGMQVWELGLSSTSTPTVPVLVAATAISRFTALGGRTILATPLGTADVLDPTKNTTGKPTVVPVPPQPAAMGATALSNSNYMAIIFHPDGSTSLPLSATDVNASGAAGSSTATYYWSLTCCDAVPFIKTPGTLPIDSAVIQIDAISGTAQVLRP